MAVSEETLRQITATIVGDLHPIRIVLFGSHARKEARDDSDLDLLVIEDQPYGPGNSRRKRQADIWKMLEPYSLSKDVLCYSVDEVERFRTSLNHVIGRALREGVTLYERP